MDGTQDTLDRFKIILEDDGLATFILNKPGQDFRPSLRVFGAGDTNNFFATEASTNGTSEEELSLVIGLEAGEYFVQLITFSTSGGTRTGAYDLQFSVRTESQPTNSPSTSDDFFANAPEIEMGNNHVGNIGYYRSDGSRDGLDRFKVTLDNGGLTTFTLAKPGEDFRPGMRIFASSDTNTFLNPEAFTSSTNEKSLSLEIVLEAGEYFLQIFTFSTSGGSRTGTYSLTYSMNN